MGGSVGRWPSNHALVRQNSGTKYVCAQGSFLSGS
jgi:hypothetical protein